MSLLILIELINKINGEIGIKDFLAYIFYKLIDTRFYFFFFSYLRSNYF